MPLEKLLKARQNGRVYRCLPPQTARQAWRSTARGFVMYRSRGLRNGSRQHRAAAGESAEGSTAIHDLTTVRMLMLKPLHNLSDDQKERQLPDRMSYSCFCFQQVVGYFFPDWRLMKHDLVGSTRVGDLPLTYSMTTPAASQFRDPKQYFNSPLTDRGPANQGQKDCT